MSSITGDMTALDELAKRIARLAKVPERAAEIAAPELTAQAQADFAAGRSPYGDAWPTNKDGSARTLHRSGDLEGAQRYKVSGAKVVLAKQPAYARFQNPKLWVPRRNALPGSYEGHVSKACEQAATAIMGGRS